MSMFINLFCAEMTSSSLWTIIVMTMRNKWKHSFALFFFLLLCNNSDFFDHLFLLQTHSLSLINIICDGATKYITLLDQYHL